MRRCAARAGALRRSTNWTSSSGAQHSGSAHGPAPATATASSTAVTATDGTRTARVRNSARSDGRSGPGSRPAAPTTAVAAARRASA